MNHGPQLTDGSCPRSRRWSLCNYIADGFRIKCSRCRRYVDSLLDYQQHRHARVKLRVTQRQRQSGSNFRCRRPFFALDACSILSVRFHVRSYSCSYSCNSYSYSAHILLIFCILCSATVLPMRSSCEVVSQSCPGSCPGRLILKM